MTGLAKLTLTRLRIEISNEGGQTASDVAYRLEVSEPNPATCAAGTYERVSTNTHWEMADSSYITDGEVTANIVPGLTDENTTFVAGQSKDTGDQTSGITLTSTEFTEIEYSIQATTTATNGATYCFRLTNVGAVLNTYSVYPEITTASAAVVSVSVSDGIVTYGMMQANTSKTTLSGELNDMQTATNDGNVTENFNIKSQDGTGGGCTWTLASTNGSDQYIHQFCNDTDNDCSGPPTNYTALTTGYQALDTGIAVSGTVDFQLRLTTPNPSSCFGQQSVNITIQAVQP